MNFKQIDAEMEYNPPWYKDKKYFWELWNSQYVTDHYLIILARLYTRYSHMNQSSVLCALDTILKRFGLANKESLYRKTRNLYSKGYKIRIEKSRIY